jgi:hypothetical protein
VEGQLASIFSEQGSHIHDLRLERIEAVYANRNQFIEQLIDISTGVDEYILASLMHSLVHALEGWIDKSVPNLWPHLQAVLLTPIIPKIHRINVIFHGFLHLSDVVIRDGIQQSLNEFGMIVEVRQKVLHAAQSPGAFIQRESNLEDPETVGEFSGPLQDIREKAPVEWVR